MPAVAPKAILKTPEAIEYVGGERLFEGLRQHHGDILKPFSRTRNNACTWRVATLDTAIAAAEAAGTFIETVTHTPPKPRRRRRIPTAQDPPPA
jgi:hypothetical protein